MNAAILNTLAFNDPPKLKVEGQAALDAACHTPDTRAKDEAAWRAAADRLTAAVDHGKLLED